ncbi:unnamed protein product [Mytilus edulis]|uniref:Ig-like domain-containing protein n=1 Tax=Mytilus edulis TaxID=6550 RepID=A0A8S3RTQ3_MYTED|nr:unnamed protein product [Mytilus edulis]
MGDTCSSYTPKSCRSFLACIDIKYIPIKQVNLKAIPNDINPTDILSGSSQHFICTTDEGRPSSEIQWYMSGVNITDDAVVQPDTCNPGFKPVIFEIPDYNITEGSNFEITPTIDANPDPISVWWTRQNQPEFIYYGKIFTIQNIQRVDSDNYTCHAMNTITAQGHPTKNRSSEEIANCYEDVGAENSNTAGYVYENMNISDNAFLLTTSSDRATTGNEFNFTCNLAKDANGIISIVRDHTDECIIDVDRSCRLQNCNPNYVYSCNGSTICLTIPVKFDIDSLHGSRWKCHDILREIYSNEVLLYVNVSPSDESINGAAIGVGTGFAVIVFTLGVTSLFVFMHRKRRMFKKRDDDYQQNRASKSSSTYEEFGEVKSNNTVYANKTMNNTAELHRKDMDTDVYVNTELKPSTKT